MFDYRFIKLLEEFKYVLNCSGVFKDYKDMESKLKYNRKKIKKEEMSLFCDNNRAENFIVDYLDFIMYYDEWYNSY